MTMTFPRSFNLDDFRDRALAEVRSREAVRLRSLDTGRTFDVPADGKVEMPMDAHSAEFFSVEPLNPGEWTR